MYQATIKHRFSKIDQENVAEKVIQWKASSPEDFIYFQPYGDVSSATTDGEDHTKEQDPSTLLFVHQSTWQCRLLKRYGNMCLLDATYKTTQGCALTAPGHLRRLTFGLGRLKIFSWSPGRATGWCWFLDLQSKKKKWSGINSISSALSLVS